MASEVPACADTRNVASRTDQGATSVGQRRLSKVGENRPEALAIGIERRPARERSAASNSWSRPDGASRFALTGGTQVGLGWLKFRGSTSPCAL